MGIFCEKKQRKAVFEYLFQEGVLVVKKDNTITKHEDIAAATGVDVPNLIIVKLMQGLTTKKLVASQWNWGYSYFFLTDKGIEYLRGYLHLPEEIVPLTLKKAKSTPKSQPTDAPKGDAKPKSAPAPSTDFKPEYRTSGVGRGNNYRTGQQQPQQQQQQQPAKNQ